MAITDWPEAERPREKLLARGAEALSDAELLAIFLRTGVRGKTAVDLARELLTRFGGLRNLLTASRESLCEAVGLGEAKYVQLVAALEVGRRHLEAKLVRGAALESPSPMRRSTFCRHACVTGLTRCFAAYFSITVIGCWRLKSCSGDP